MIFNFLYLCYIKCHNLFLFKVFFLKEKVNLSSSIIFKSTLFLYKKINQIQKNSHATNEITLKDEL